jgi:multidrug resistance protein, MATE family
MIRRELGPMLRLAAPVVMAELGWVTMGIVDTLMVGRLGADAIGAVGLASMLFFAIAIFAMGLLLGLDPLVAQAFGAGRPKECQRWLTAGVWLCALITLPVVGVLLALNAWLPRWGLPEPVLRLTQPYLVVLTFGLPPLLLYVAFRRYLQAIGIVRPVMVTLILANVVNAVANWLLIYGHLGSPALGVRGSAYATLIARVFMAGLLFVEVLRHLPTSDTQLPSSNRQLPTSAFQPLALDLVRQRRLFALGLPAAGQAVLEVGVFAAATALAGRVSADALAAHQIALNMAAFTFMVPFGLASAAAVRVGHAVGRGDAHGVSSAGWTAIALAVGFMAVAATVFLVAPVLLMGAFTRDPNVIATGAALLFVAAIFQLFDGLQGVTTGVLRGVADTRTPMLWNFAGHWLFGLPLGYALCFSAGLGVVGLWWGLSAGLIVCGVALLIVWIRRVAQLKLRATDRRSHSAQL